MKEAEFVSAKQRGGDERRLSRKQRIGSLLNKGVLQSKTTIVKLTERSETMTRHKEIARQLSERTALQTPIHHL